MYLEVKKIIWHYYKVQFLEVYLLKLSGLLFN